MPILWQDIRNTPLQISCPITSKMGEHFAAYLQTPEAQQLMAAGMAGIFDMEALQTQLASALGDYMQTVMSSYTGAVAQAMENQISTSCSRSWDK